MPHERPDDTLLENDVELDEWWERFIEDKSRQVAKAMGAKSSDRVQGSQHHIPTFAG